MDAPNHDENGPDAGEGSTYRGDPDPMADPGTPGAADTGLGDDKFPLEVEIDDDNDPIDDDDDEDDDDEDE